MTEFSRRNALAVGAASGAVAALGLGRARAADTPQPALPIPPEVKANARGEISFSARTGTAKFVSGHSTRTYGYSAQFLGPALRLRRGEKVAIDFTNHLSELTTVHWHGLVIPGHLDGGPHQPVAPGGQWRPTLTIDQPAATLWFHPHNYPTTANQVIMGLAGLLIIDDEETNRLALPSRWGINDIPLIIQDRRFLRDGQFFDRMNLTAITNGYVGDVALVNGARHPVARTARGWVRLRLLDGSNARSYLLKASDDRSLFVIGSDGGLLENPVEMKQIAMHAGERFEVMVDCRSGAPFDLLAMPTGQPIMRLPPFDVPLPLVSIRPDGAEIPGQLPAALVKLPPIPATLPAISRELVMNMFRDKEGMAPLAKAGLPMGMAMGAASPMPSGHAGGMSMGGMSMGSTIDAAVVARVVKLIEDQPEMPRVQQLSTMGINGRSFSMTGDSFSAQRGQDLRWRISEGDDQMPHPVHIHGCQFRIVSESGQKPEAYRAGLKDIAPIANGGFSEILVKFPYPADAKAPYMAHCHILEHEDSGMMTAFAVA
ncbi:MAG TPA: multicopper oxidase CueO [Acetobacteraceae bacterium]|nr:multicopper oxidase CueO [Acetobacteraceae bacterium]